MKLKNKIVMRKTGASVMKYPVVPTFAAVMPPQPKDRLKDEKAP
jgi:hypothetical protein